MPMRTKSSASVDATRSQSWESMPFQKLATASFSAMTTTLSEQVAHGSGDHQLLPRLHHQHPHLGVGCRHVGVNRVGPVGLTIDSHAEKLKPLRDPGAHLGRVLTDPSGEHKGVDPAEGGDHG